MNVMTEIPDVPMTSIEIVVSVVLLLAVLAAIFGLIALGAWLGFLPGRVADERGHPRTAAIKVSSWAGLLLMGPLWPVALIWAHTSPVDADAESIPSLKGRGAEEG